jgi:hypothetical protein
LFATILETKRSARDRHANDFRLNTATMNGKFESNSNNHDESNLNRLRCVARVGAPAMYPLSITDYAA